MDIEFFKLQGSRLKFTTPDCCKDYGLIAGEMSIVETLRTKFNEENMFETAIRCLKHIFWLLSLFSSKLVNKDFILYVVKGIR